MASATTFSPRSCIGVSDPMRLIKHPEVKAKGVPFSGLHLQRLEDAGKFPRRIRLGTRTHRWVEEDVDQWIADRLAEAGIILCDEPSISSMANASAQSGRSVKDASAEPAAATAALVSAIEM
jgi:prophage regulatory protein